MMNLGVPTAAQAAAGTPRQGFTLIELLIVVVIAGALTALGLPSVLTQSQRARENAAVSAAMAAARACAAVLVDGTAADYEPPQGVSGSCGVNQTFTYTDPGNASITGSAQIDANGAVRPSD